MNQRLLDRLDKILALADSDQQGEAVSAVRMARQVLAEAGFSFSDLVAQAQKRKMPQSFLSASFLSSAALPASVAQEPLRESLIDALNALQARDARLNAANRQIRELKAKLAHSQQEARRWHQLARDTVDTLWDLGGSTQAEGLSLSPFMAPDQTLAPARKTA